MAYESVFDREQAVRAEEAQREAAADERSRERQLATKAEEDRRNAVEAHPRHLDAMTARYDEGKNIEYARAEMVKRNDAEIRENPRLIDGGLPRNVARTFAIAGVPGTLIIDYFFLAGASTFFLSLAGITSNWITWPAKALLPGALILVEVGLGVWAYIKTENVRPLRSYMIPLLIAIIAALTFLAVEGITTPSDIGLIAFGQFVVILLLGWVIHYAIVANTRLMIEGIAYALFRRKRQKCERLTVEAEAKYSASVQEFVYTMRVIETARRDFGIEIAPHFHLVREDVRIFINERMGYEAIPRLRSFDGNGVSAEFHHESVGG